MLCKSGYGDREEGDRELANRGCDLYMGTCMGQRGRSGFVTNQAWNGIIGLRGRSLHSLNCSRFGIRFRTWIVPEHAILQPSCLRCFGGTIIF